MPENDTNYYDVLGVLHTASAEEIEGAFRNLARKWHPDVCPHIREAAEQFKLIAEAYEVLGDSEKRKHYDRARSTSLRRRPTSSYQARTGMAPVHRQSTDVRGFNQLPGDLYSLIQSLFFGSNPTWATTASPCRHGNKQLDLDVQLPISPEEAARGGTIQFSLTLHQHCPACHGEAEPGRATCKRCGGIGITGKSRRPVTIDIPPGVSTGTVIRVPRAGKVAPDSEMRGDLYVQVQVRPCW